LGYSERRGSDVGNLKLIGNKCIFCRRECEKEENVDEKEEESSK
jgi:hypothetical protein